MESKKIITKKIVNTVTSCIYCGNNQKGFSKEHIIPDTIGGYNTVHPVCKVCNNGVLSTLDKELCSHSPLAMVASEEISDQRSIQDLWLIDETQNNLLIEGQWDAVEKLHHCYPQLILQGEKAQLRADGNEMETFGLDNFQQLFVKAAKHAYQMHLQGKGKLFFEPVDKRFFPDSNRLPPRIFSRHKLSELKIGSTFILRYSDEADKRHLLDKLSKGQIFKKTEKAEFYQSGQTIAFQVMFSPVLIGRAFMKIGLNVLHSVCTKTEVSIRTFPDAFELVTGNRTNNSYIESGSGFVKAVDLSSMDCKPNEHRIWIMRENNNWTVKISFFGGRIGGITSFSGLSNEEWKFADIRCPIDTPQQIVKKSSLYIAGSVPVQSKIFSEIVPSVEAFNTREGRFFVKKK